MEKSVEGLFAISKCGHDKGKLYVIVRQDERYVYVADGVLKLLESPKRKNRKHIQIINKKAVNLEMPEVQGLSNENIKRAIKLYR